MAPQVGGMPPERPVEHPQVEGSIGENQIVQQALAAINRLADQTATNTAVLQRQLQTIQTERREMAEEHQQVVEERRETDAERQQIAEERQRQDEVQQRLTRQAQRLDLRAALRTKQDEKRRIEQQLAQARQRHESCTDSAIIKKGFWTGVKAGLAASAVNPVVGAAVFIGTWAGSSMWESQTHLDEGTQWRATGDIRRLTAELATKSQEIGTLQTRIRALNL